MPELVAKRVLGMVWIGCAHGVGVTEPSFCFECFKAEMIRIGDEAVESYKNKMTAEGFAGRVASAADVPADGCSDGAPADRLEDGGF